MILTCLPSEQPCPAPRCRLEWPTPGMYWGTAGNHSRCAQEAVFPLPSSQSPASTQRPNKSTEHQIKPNLNQNPRTPAPAHLPAGVWVALWAPHRPCSWCLGGSCDHKPRRRHTREVPAVSQLTLSVLSLAAGSSPSWPS